MKTRLKLATLLAVTIVMTLLSACVLAARGEDKPAAKPADVVGELEKAKQRLAPTYTLAYKFQAGEQIRTKVVHLATVETKIKGTSQTTKSRTVSTRVWRIKDVAPSGQILFENVVERVEMWNSVDGRQEVRYDSAADKTPPPQFEHVAASVGKVLATVTINPQGRILARQNTQPQFNPGIGDLTIPFPDVAVKVGASWSIPDELKIAGEDGRVKRIETRQRYRLDKVEAGVATIGVETEVLTPVNDPKIESQLVQRLQRGQIRFDMDAGRLIYKQMDIDEEVFGFSGPESHMQYLARLTEEPAAADGQLSQEARETKVK